MPPTISSEYRTNIVRTMPVEFASKHDCPADVELSWGDSLAGAFMSAHPGKDIRRYRKEFDEVAAELGRTLAFFKVPEREEEALAAFAPHKGEVTEGYL